MKNKFKLKESELNKIINKSLVKILKENSFDDENEEFVPQGSYTISNSGGYLIQLSDNGEMAKVKDAFGSDNPEISDWLPIEYVDTDEVDEDGYPELEPVIDPDGYNIPLNQVMRLNAFESKIRKNKIKESMRNITNKKRPVNESDFSVLAPVLAGAAAVGLSSYAISKLMTALENGKLGTEGKKLARLLNQAGSTVNSGREVDDDIQTESRNRKTTTKIKLSELKSMITNMIREEYDGLGKGNDYWKEYDLAGGQDGDFEDDDFYNTNTKMFDDEESGDFINESDFSVLAPVLGGAAAVGLSSYAISKLMTALENGKLGEEGKKLARLLNQAGSTVNSGRE